jgi:hypothetical protein
MSHEAVDNPGPARADSNFQSSNGRAEPPESDEFMLKML